MQLGLPGPASRQLQGNPCRMNHRGSPSPMGWSVSRLNGLFRQRQALWGHLPRLSETEFASAGESGLQHRAAVGDLVIHKEEVSTEAKGFTRRRSNFRTFQATTSSGRRLRHSPGCRKLRRCVGTRLSPTHPARQRNQAATTHGGGPIRLRAVPKADAGTLRCWSGPSNVRRRIAIPRR